VYELKRDWDGTVHELADELDKAMRTAFQELEDGAVAIISIELAMKAVLGVKGSDHDHYIRQLKQIHEELVHPGPDEFPSAEEMREQAGCDRYHALKDEGLMR
jgi:hypothetical protein